TSEFSQLSACSSPIRAYNDLCNLSDSQQLTCGQQTGLHRLSSWPPKPQDTGRELGVTPSRLSCPAPAWPSGCVWKIDTAAAVAAAAAENPFHADATSASDSAGSATVAGGLQGAPLGNFESKGEGSSSAAAAAAAVQQQSSAQQDRALPHELRPHAFVSTPSVSVRDPFVLSTTTRSQSPWALDIAGSQLRLSQHVRWPATPPPAPVDGETEAESGDPAEPKGSSWPDVSMTVKESECLTECWILAADTVRTQNFRLGAYVIRWRRQAAQMREQIQLPIVSTTVPLPAVNLYNLPLCVSLSLPPSGTVYQPVSLAYSLENRTAYPQEVQFSVDRSDCFMFSGMKTGRVLELHRRVLELHRRGWTFRARVLELQGRVWSFRQRLELHRRVLELHRRVGLDLQGRVVLELQGRSLELGQVTFRILPQTAHRLEYCPTPMSTGLLELAVSPLGWTARVTTVYTLLKDLRRICCPPPGPRPTSLALGETNTIKSHWRH
uniref:Arrestin_N domain-containing protein n=1 Tax=Macrostomum lignano TaxID=282301 RepID=A0A1I8FNE8_9PLAT